MRELTLNEVQDVNGGFFFIVAAILWIDKQYKDKPVDGNAATEGEMPRP